MSVHAGAGDSLAQPRPQDPARDAIAVNLRSARLSQGLSLRDLAEQTRASKALLSQIERGVANPTIDVLGRIGAVLNLSVADLIRTPLLGPEVIRHGAGAEIVRDHVIVRTLFSTSDRRRFELAEGHLPPHRASTRSAHGRGSVEYAYVTEGSVRIESHGWSVDVDRGDCVRFSSESEHSYVTGPEGASVLTLVSFSDD